MLQPQPVNINFSQGLNQKTDKWQIPIGQFYQLNNSVFAKGGLLQKRNGFGPLPALPDATSTYLTTFADGLVAIGTKLRALSSSTDQWIDKGAFTPLTFSQLPAARSALSQTQCDSVVASNGLACTVYTDNSNGTSLYKYTIQDSSDGQIIVPGTAIPVGSGTVSGSPRVFNLGGYFIIVFTNTISAATHLQYIAISTASPTTIVQSNTDIASSYVASSTVSWDGVVVGNQLFIAYNTTAGGQQVAITYLSTALGSPAASTSFASSIATIMSVCADTSGSSPVIYASFWDASGSTGNAVAINSTLQKLMSATQWLGSGNILNVASAAQNGVLTIIYENSNNYSYDSSVPTHYCSQNTVTLPATVTTGTVGSAAVMLRSVGLASKAFVMNSTVYALTEYSSVFQPTYFLSDTSGNIIARFAYENGGGYLTAGLPQAQVTNSSVRIAYLYKDLITSVNKTQGLANAAGVYSQTGVNVATLAFGSDTLSTAEIGQNLNLSGGYLYAYDGSSITEQGFHVFPDNIEAALVADPGPTGTLSNVTTPTLIKSMSSVAGIVPGMVVTDVTNAGALSAGTTVISVDSSTQITISSPALAAHSGDTLKFVGAVTAQQYFYQVIYQWTDAQGNIFNSAPSIPVTVTAAANHTSVTIQGPYLRLTSKANVKIIIYRWSAAQQEYFQLTSLTNPIVNSKTSDSWSYTDILADTAIAGNGLIYTNGGVLENIAGPACTALTLFDTRLWAIRAENPNVLLQSKQVIEGVPVEMSDLLTFYVAPNAGTTASTGPMRCLAPMDDKLIIFKKDALYYINGVGPDNTGANGQYPPSPIFITSSVGSINQNSIVLTPNGLMFQSDKGIWLLGRDLSTSYIGAAVENSNTQTVTSAVSIPETTQVRFTLSNKTTIMYDYYFQQWGTFINTNAVSSTIYEGLHTYISSTGGVFQETPGVYLDGATPVLLSFTTGWLNLAGLQGYQLADRLFLLGEYITPHKLEVGIAYNYNSSIYQRTNISPTNFSSAEPSPFGDQPAPMGASDAVESWRIFFARKRCSSVQISLTEAYDPTPGVAAGAGFTLSGMNLLVGIKSGFRPASAAHSAGGGQNRG